MAVDQLEQRAIIDEATYRRLALHELDGPWELHDARLREKPAVSYEHGGVKMKLAFSLQQQLGWDTHRVRVESARLRVSSRRICIPDVAVVPLPFDLALRVRPNTSELYEAPLPLVAEVWSPSIGVYDIESKVIAYQERSDHEIWYPHPYDRTLTAWVIQPDGAYEQSVHRGGTVRAAYLPGVAVDLAWLFEP
jgi:Uma2 family endonuclease